MRKIVAFLIMIFSVFTIVAQEELNAIVTVNADKVQSSNKQVYRTLQESLTEFINQTKWTNKKFLPQERINCAFTIIVSSQDNNNFSASLQVQATRPVFNSSYETPILNINDTNFNFKYNEFDPLIYNPNSFDNNLVSTIVFYIYTVLGIDADTFALKGGEQYLKQAQNVALKAQQSRNSGWENEVGKQNRYTLIDNLLSSKFSAIRSIYYNYHRKGLDLIEDDEKAGKITVLNNILQLEKLYNITVGNYLIRVFLDAKSDEIIKIFSDGKSTGKELQLKEVLQKIASTQNSRWKKIKL